MTAETWLPLLEELGLEQGVDVTIAYCPERFNPGDPARGTVGRACHRLQRREGGGSTR